MARASFHIVKLKAVVEQICEIVIFAVEMSFVYFWESVFQKRQRVFDILIDTNAYLKLLETFIRLHACQEF
jgi:hypothetical protein